MFIQSIPALPDHLSDKMSNKKRLHINAQSWLRHPQHGRNHSNNYPTADDTSFYTLAPQVFSVSHRELLATPQTTYDEFDDGSKAVQYDANPDFDYQNAMTTGPPKAALPECDEGTDDLPSLFPTNDMTSRRQSVISAFQPTSNDSTATFPTQAAANLHPMDNSMRPQSATQELHANYTSLQQMSGFHASLPTDNDRVMETSSERPNSSDSGTYTCTYHGCKQRFDTQMKLQNHKREVHRQTVADHDGEATPSQQSSQAGPHKCERINPSTGKPCNSIFSRPYDLTRHEDTIHNARKQKVRCYLCTEEKSFSRNDALTRHIRAIHPEVDWPGKQRRKGY